MKNTLFRTLAAATLFALAGCFSFERQKLGSPGGALSSPTHPGQPVEHVVVRNRGMYLFNTYTVLCGNADEHASWAWKSFTTNHVDETVLMKRLTDYAAARGCDVTETQFFSDENIFLEIYGIPIPIPYLLCRHELQISSVLVKSAPQSRSQRAALSHEMRNLLDTLPNGGAK